MTFSPNEKFSSVSSSKPSRTTLRTFVTRLIFLCMLPPLALAVWLAIDSVQQQHERFVEDAGLIAQNFAVAVDNRLRARISGLTMLALSPLVDDARRWPELYREAQRFQQSFGSHVIFATAAEPMPPMATSNSPICGRVKFPQGGRQERLDCYSEWVPLARRLAASLRR